MAIKRLLSLLVRLFTEIAMPSTDIPQDPRERREWIMFRLRVAGYSFASLARELGVERRTPQTVLHRPYPKMERAISHVLGLEPQQIWPERYTADGRPNRPMGRPRFQQRRAS